MKYSYMKRKEYIRPQTDVVNILQTSFIALSGGEQTETPVHNPDDEVDAGSALVKQHYNVWDEQW